MHICIITNKYPNPVEPNVLVFLQQLVNEMAIQGVKCSVICPLPTNLNRKLKALEYHTRVELPKDCFVDLYRPQYVSLGQTGYRKLNPAKITTSLFIKAVDRVISQIMQTEQIDALYSHFVTPAGIAAAQLGRKYHLPAYMAYGEATLKTIQHYGPKGVKKQLQSLSGVIAVSSQNKEMIAPYVPDGITRVFPNSIDASLFQPCDRQLSREKYGLPVDAFIVSFVGSFDERKGINRLSDAIDAIHGDCYLICAGKGKVMPETKFCLMHEPVLHSELPSFLSASDIFVLPTRHEGCCNAIIEAMACGLPIVSSDRSFNDDILNAENSVRIDSDSIPDIQQAIILLKNDPLLREKMSAASLQKAKELTLPRRAENIIHFIEQKNIEYHETNIRI